MATAKKTSAAKTAAPAPAKAAKTTKAVAAAPEVAPTAPAAAVAPAASGKRAPNAAFMKPLKPSAALAAVVGKTPLPRTEIVSKLWVYIKQHNLQEPTNKRMINADAKLKEIFGKPQVSMFEMAGLIGKHVQ